MSDPTTKKSENDTTSLHPGSSSADAKAVGGTNSGVGSSSGGDIDTDVVGIQANHSD